MLLGFNSQCVVDVDHALQDFDKLKFWRKFSRKAKMYHPRTNNIHHPTLQFMHKWLDFTLFPNSDFGTVRVDDLRLLYALVKRRKVPPVKSKMRHCLEVFSLTGDLTGETFLLLTKAYNSLRSSTLTVRKSGLGNKVKPYHLCMNRNVG